MIATLEPGKVCGSCSMRAPPVHLCRMCRKEVKDWPADEIGHLEERGWELVEGLWTEPRAYVLRSPTPEMVAKAMDMVNHYEAMIAGQKGEYWRNDKLIPLEIAKGLEKARTNLASLQAGEQFECRPRMRLSQQAAVQAEYIRRHEFDPRTIDKVVPAYTDEWLASRTQEALTRWNAGAVQYLPQHERDTIEDRRERTITVHQAMCSECRQY